MNAFMFFHGGGWILGDFPTYESRYRVAINEAYAATKWVADNVARRCIRRAKN